MTESTLPLAELLAKAGDGDFLRSVAEAVVQLLMETDVEGLIGAGRHERYRRAHDVSQRRPGPGAGHAAGQPAAAHPQAAAGQLLSAVPGSPAGRRRKPWWPSSQRSIAVAQEAWVSGVSTRRVDDLVQAMGLRGIGKSTVCPAYSTRGDAPVR